MTQVTIENPILNSPYDEPTRHFRFSDEGITNEIVEERRGVAQLPCWRALDAAFVTDMTCP